MSGPDSRAGAALGATLECADALDWLARQPPGSIDLVLTDPPYNSGGRTMADRTRVSARDKYAGGDATHHLTFQGDNRDQRSFTYWLTLILGHAHRAAARGAYCLVFTDWRQLPAVSDALQAAGWTWRGIIVWHKPIARPQRGRFTQACEFVVWATRGRPARADGVYPGLLVGSQPRGAERHHLTQKPVDVVRQLVRICPDGGTVCDPFAGSGTTAVAAIREGRDFSGCDIDPAFVAVARRRIADALDAAGQLTLDDTDTDTERR